MREQILQHRNYRIDQILGNQAHGIASVDGDATITDSTIEAPNAYGVITAGHEVTIRRVTISEWAFRTCAAGSRFATGPRP